MGLHEGLNLAVRQLTARKKKTWNGYKPESQSEADTLILN